MRAREEWIPLSDGARLAVTLYLPDTEPDRSAPGILEYLPYRKDDGMLERDHDLYTYVTERGYVGARVDIRGTGRSEGILPDGEYSETEQRDGEEVIAWLAARGWCNGAVGMWGISWGGFNAIHQAMRRPPALRAITALMASDDLFHDDIHYIDGLMHVDEYEMSIDLWNAMTRAPDFPLDEGALAARFDRPPWFLSWLREQRDGPYWRRGSLAPDYSRLGVPALLIGGWWDGYRDSVFRMLECCAVPTRAIVGPWNHTFPHRAVPGPEIEWRREAVRWWDRWLKGERNGVEEEPRLAVYVQSWRPPDPSLEVLPGRWRLEDGWPPERLREEPFHLRADGRLGEVPGPAATDALRYMPPAGTEGGFWWGELTPDQRPSDAFSLVYESEALAGDLEILGMPVAELRGGAYAPVADWFVRLSDVAPDGTVTLVAGTGLAGAQRDSPAAPEPLEPGETYDLRVRMHACSWVFPAGHRIRLAVSNAQWPMIWPTPHPMTTFLEVGEGGSRLILPVVPFGDRPVPEFDRPAPPQAPEGVGSEGSIEPVDWRVHRDEAAGRTFVEWEATSRAWFPWGDQRYVERLEHSVADAGPEAAACDGEASIEVSLPGREIVWSCELRLTSDATCFDYRFTRRLTENGRPVRERTWAERVARDLQ